MDKLTGPERALAIGCILAAGFIIVMCVDILRLDWVGSRVVAAAEHATREAASG